MNQGPSDLQSDALPTELHRRLSTFFATIFFVYECSTRLLSRLAQLVERKTLNLVVVGSSPTVGAFSFSALAFQRPEVLFLACYKRACIQTKCYSPLTLTLEGGCPASQIFRRGQLLWRSWQRVGLIIPRSRVRSSPGAHAFLSVCSFLLLLLLTYLLTYLLTAKRN